MTTARDAHDSPVEVVPCPKRRTNLYPSLVLALRDMRKANGRDMETGQGVGNESWIGLSLGMVVLDSLTPDNKKPGPRWRRLLTTHATDDEDAKIIYALRCSLLHGYGLPKPGASTGNRRIMLTADQQGWALDTRVVGWAKVSAPLFCGRLVERIVSEAPSDWDDSLIDTDFHWPGDRSDE